MKFGAVPLDEALGMVLAHNVLDEAGHKVLGKGYLLTLDDLRTLRQLGLSSVVVAALGKGDLSENEAAQRVGAALVGSGIRMVATGAGRANLIAEQRGPLRINVAALDRLNNIDEGITIATLREHTLVQPGELVALVKIIPFAVAAGRVADVEAVAKEAAPLLAVRPLRACSVALIVSGPASARDRLLDAFSDPVRQRIENLNSRLEAIEYVDHTPEALSAALRRQHEDGRQLIIIAGVSAIIDRADVVPTALKLAGGDIAHFGVPVDPGSLLMLGYIQDVPVIGAPSCIKSLKTNVIDWILPRLLAGERLARADFVVMGHGGLLEDISERPMPRS